MEEQRFEKLMEYFKNEDNNIDFMVSLRTIVMTVNCAAIPENPFCEAEWFFSVKSSEKMMWTVMCGQKRLETGPHIPV